MVFAGGLTNDLRLPANEKLSGATLARLIEGIRAASGAPANEAAPFRGTVFGSQSSARVMAEAAAALGVNPKDLVLETKSKDTEK